MTDLFAFLFKTGTQDVKQKSELFTWIEEVKTENKIIDSGLFAVLKSVC